MKNTGAISESAEKLGSKHLADWATKVLQMIPESGKSVLWATLSSDSAAFTPLFSVAALLYLWYLTPQVVTGLTHCTVFILNK